MFGNAMQSLLQSNSRFTLLVVYLITLAATSHSAKVETKTVCETEGCVRASEKLASALDRSIDPCDNFYDFACGNFIPGGVIPDDKTKIDTIAVMNDHLQQQIRSILEQKPQEDEIKAFKMTKDYYASCMNSTAIEEQGIEPLKKLLQSLGGWPAVEGDDWSNDKFDWIELMKKFRREGLGHDYILDFGVMLDLKNKTIFIAAITRAIFGLSNEFLKKGLEEERVKAYQKFMIDVAVLFGANRSRAEIELKESLQFEIALAQLAPSYIEYTITARYYPSTIKQLQDSNPYINWLDYMNAMLPEDQSVNENDTVNNMQPEFFNELGKFLASTPNRTLANYIMWRAVNSVTTKLTTDVRNLRFEFNKVLYGVKKQEPRWLECSEAVTSSMGIAVGAQYVRKYFNESSKGAVLDMLADIRAEFLDILQNVNWMDDETRRIALEKARTTTYLIGYPDELLNETKIEEYFRNLEIQSDNFLANHLRLDTFEKDVLFGHLISVTDKVDWTFISRPTEVNAFNVLQLNNLQFPAAILQEPFFSPDRPRYMNYGGVGFIIGHETTHGFDDTGSKFDLDGNMNDWWDPNTRAIFLERTKCVIGQYDNITDSKTNLTLRGEASRGNYNRLSENIADIGGIREAYYAYSHWVDRNQPEGVLPNLNFNQNQIFWISFAQSWCAVYRLEELKNEILTSDHLPHMFRINGAAMNMEEFSSDFNCPTDSPMNPSKKCRVW
ncbi:Neprilysin-2 [Pseudolycoriella hygida]|uniref:Neprilysin-2 n=1 Tax=Pseudolycoriella hygida TaxID=35572 RepID=A0A9Q0NFR1_9DIPT|nr:Neprilysin-2 [Pseudolycoriella hygida]